MGGRSPCTDVGLVPVLTAECNAHKGLGCRFLVPHALGRQSDLPSQAPLRRLRPGSPGGALLCAPILTGTKSHHDYFNAYKLAELRQDVGDVAVNHAGVVYESLFYQDTVEAIQVLHLHP